MFRFSLEVADVVELPPFLDKIGIVRDHDSAPIATNGTAEVVYRWDAVSPRDLREAVDLVRGVLFFPPLRVWLGGEEYRVGTQESGSALLTA